MVYPVRVEAWLVLALLGALVPLPAQAAIYCCDSASGRQICADVLPVQCYGRAYRIMNRQGMVLEEVGRPLTEEEIRAARKERRLKRIEANKLRLAKLRERALLETYQTIDDIDAQEQRALAEVQVDIEKAVKAEQELLKDRARLGREKEFYAGQPVPVELKQKLRDNELEILSQRSVIDVKRKHVEAIQKRYQDDRIAYQKILDRREALLRR